MLGIWYRGWGFSFFSLKYCCSSCFRSFAKRAISTQSSAFAAMAMKVMPKISFRRYLVFPCWRVSRLGLLVLGCQVCFPWF